MSDEKFGRINEEDDEDTESPQLSIEEKNALAKAVVAVKKHAESYIEKGLSPFSFFSG